MKKLPLVILLCSMIGLLGLNAKEAYTMDFDRDTKSLVRKMHVYKQPGWVAKIKTKDAKEFYFVSPKSMFEFYYNPEKWEQAKVKDTKELKQIVVTDFTTLKPINAKGAFYVYGSNEISPAGDDLPAFENFDEAEEFAKKYNGKRVLNFKEVKNSLIQLLNGDI